MVRIRLKRVGAKKHPFYRIVVVDQRAARDGAFIEQIGTYDPFPDPPEIKIDEEKVAKFGGQVPMNRAGQPCEVAPAYVYLASADSSYVSGQTLHVNGGVILNT